MKTVAKSLKDEQGNKIIGQARVGELAKGLLLASEKAVNLVVICLEPPTVGMLKKVSKKANIFQLVESHSFQTNNYMHQVQVWVDLQKGIAYFLTSAHGFGTFWGFTTENIFLSHRYKDELK